jgi:hypothetical protein
VDKRCKTHPICAKNKIKREKEKDESYYDLHVYFYAGKKNSIFWNEKNNAWMCFVTTEQFVF